jgi:eukaryotic-like serine/threonine-protein kinase
MTSERWRHVERLYHAATAEAPEARRAFLADACAGDGALRDEVESLLEHASSAGVLDDAVSGFPGALVSLNPSPTAWIGRRLGVYEVVSSIGSGAMGQVYRARDTRLGRDVAVKIVPPLLTAHRDRIARFEREARALASLNHPNIATIHGVEEIEDTRALVMELVGGETLAERLGRQKPRGAGLDVQQALGIADQIVDALDAAHEKGIVHRDLKPANIKITPEGVVKVLDFGLAKAIGAPEVPPSDRQDDRALGIVETRDGVILGTPAYMSPEQARGESVDKRTDIWAFGCVLYEMLSGRTPFGGATMSEVTASAIPCEPDLDAMPEATPEPVRRLLCRCLENASRDRLRDIGDARADISEALGILSDPARGIPRLSGSFDNWRHILTYVCVGAAAGTAGWYGTLPAAVAPPSVSRFSIATSESRPLALSPWVDLALSADGTRFAYRSSEGVIVRSRDRLDESLVRVDSDSHFFLSPDGQWLGYTAANSLKKMPVAGGPPVAVATTAPGVVASWGPDGIVFADVNGLFRVSPDGAPEKLRMATLDAGEQVSFPELLPGGRTVLVTVLPARASFVFLGGMADSAAARIEAVDLRTGARKTLVRGGGAARYVPTGHLVYVAGGTLQAVAFDVERLEVHGNSVQVSDESGASDYALSADGSLIYASGSAAPATSLVWVDRKGREEPLDVPARPYMYPQLSPDGARVALTVWSPSRTDRDIWILDLHRGSLEQSIVDPSDNSTVAWSADGRRLAFGSARVGGVFNVFWQAADGSGAAERLANSAQVQMPMAFTNDGRLLVSAEVPGERRNIVALSLDGSQRTEPIVHGLASDLSSDLSPDGRWLAYDSNESGRYEVYVRPYPNADDGRWVISIGGGRQPVWSPDGRELFYRDSSGALIAVPITLTPRFVPGRPVTLLAGGRFYGGGPAGSSQTYDVAEDGRFLMLKSANPDQSSVVVVLNWFEELKRLVPRN